MRYLTAEQAKRFASEWLPAWTGNKPKNLVSFYSDDVFYSDPAVPEGVKGKAALLDYFTKLLAYNPDWVWTQVEGIPLEDGFLNKWKALIPVAETSIEIVGVCSVQLDAAGKIRRNEVYFDRSRLLMEIAKARSKAGRAGVRGSGTA
jgi:hypothetical protein